MGHAEVESPVMPASDSGCMVCDDVESPSMAEATWKGDQIVNQSEPASEIEAALEAVGEKLVFMDVRDLAGLAGLHTDFEAIGALISESGILPQLAPIPTHAASLLGIIILEECDEPGATLESART